MAKSSPLLGILGGRLALEGLDSEEWSLAFSEARRIGLLPRFSALYLPTDTEWVSVPERLKVHSVSAQIHADAFQRDVQRELKYVQKALSRLDAPVILLKGAAYVATRSRAAIGRIFSDIDILVAKPMIGSAEGKLMLNGWLGGRLDPYDQRYYRLWSHEIPPMTHRTRGTTIDLHHSLVMPTCRLRVDSEKMLSDAIPVEGSNFWWRLKDEDMVLHAIAHLMLNSEFERGLRDIWDIDLLFRQFSAESAYFADFLMERAVEVGMEKIAQQALFLARRYFGTPVPDSIVPDQKGIFISLVESSVSTRHSDTRPQCQGFADASLCYREMYLRLPNRLLALHLAHKALDWFSRSTKPTIEQTQL